MTPDGGVSDGGIRVASRISDIIAPWAARAPDHPAVVEPGGAWTYAELARAVSQAAAWLVAKGVRGGDRVLVVNENCRAAVALVLAVASLDAWLVAVNARLSEREIDDIRAHSGARLAVFTAEVSPQARAHAQRLGAVTEEVPGVGPVAVTAVAAQAEPVPVHADPAEQVAALVYTSGTTGGAKAVMLTHRNLLFMARASGAVRSLGPDDRFYGVLPLSHIVGLSVVMLGTLMYGGALHLCQRFNPSTAIRAMERDRLTIILGVPAMYALLLEYVQAKGLAALNHPALRLLGACGAPLDPAIKSGVENLFGLTLHNGYGITECSPTIAQTRVDQPQSDCTVGRVLPGVEVKLVGHNDMVAPDGDVGELWVRGPGIMKGYYNDPEATAAAIDSEGWFNTRDLACFRNGHLYIVGRTKELIIRYGFNVYPPEIEAVLNAHPAVVQSAVIGQRIDGNEEIIAFVQTAAGATVTPAELGEAVAPQLAPYKRPSRIVLVESLPAGPTGKILKSQLAAFAQGLPREGSATSAQG